MVLEDRTRFLKNERALRTGVPDAHVLSHAYPVHTLFQSPEGFLDTKVTTRTATVSLTQLVVPVSMREALVREEEEIMRKYMT